MWWDKSPLLSHNKMLNMVLSNRGGGKTFHCTDWGVGDFLKNEKETVWVRRYGTNLTDPEKGILVGDRFFSALKKEGFYEGTELKTEGNLGFVNGKPAFNFVALSTSQDLKSINFPNVNKIIFDEFIVKGGKNGYLKDEVHLFLDLIETVARLRDDVRVIMLANSLSVVNPYFTYFGIKPDPEKRFTVKGEVCVEMFTDAEFIAKKKDTRFGKLVKGTRYSDFAIENKWLLDNDTFIEKKSPKAEFMLAMKYNGIYYGFWVDYSVGLIYVNRQYDPSSYSLYCLNKDDHEANLLLIKSLNDSKRVQRIVYAFRNALLRFEDMQVKNQFYEFIGYFVR